MTAIFLLEDNESLGKSLEQRLGQEGYRMSWARTIAEAQTLFNKSPADLAIVDVTLPDGNGFEFARTVIRPACTPIVFLSAFSSAEYRLEGYDSGAADYIPKPFHLRELLLRIKKVLETSVASKNIAIGAFTLDTDSKSIVTKSGERQFLAARDFELLQLLMKHAPKALSREEILEQVWGNDRTGTTVRTVDNTIVRLRQALGSESVRIRSVRGVGYQWIES